MLFTRVDSAARARSVKLLTLLLVLVVFPASPVAWSQQRGAPQARGKQASASGSQDAERQAGSIAGQIVDQSGAQIVGAVVKLTREGDSSEAEATSDEDGRFVFYHLAPGDFRLTVSFIGLASQEFSGTLLSGQHYATPLIMLVIPTQVTEVHVGLPPEEQAAAQIKEEEKQRVLGVVPNYYFSYLPNAAPLNAKQKFGLAWKSASDPVTVVGVGFFAGIDQASDRWGAYGQGADGYAKRFAATYVNVFGATFLGGAVLPSLLRQDPRYFYKGTGSKKSRLLYAIASSVMCKGDNGQWQPNYSNIGGSFAAAGIQYSYIPAHDRGGNFVVSSALIRIGETSLAGVLQEFVFSKLTHSAHSQRASLNQKP